MKCQITIAYYQDSNSVSNTTITRILDICRQSNSTVQRGRCGERERGGGREKEEKINMEP